MAVIDIGCCGAYCKTCRVFTSGVCRGCKHGYDTGARDIQKAKCAMKVCCIGKGYQACADCTDYDSCAILRGFYQRNGYKYQKYRQAADCIRSGGYDAFLKIADRWTGAYGKYPRGAFTTDTGDA
jgi:hypothetical protein